MAICIDFTRFEKFASLNVKSNVAPCCSIFDSEEISQTMAFESNSSHTDQGLCTYASLPLFCGKTSGFPDSFRLLGYLFTNISVTVSRR